MIIDDLWGIKPCWLKDKLYMICALWEFRAKWDTCQPLITTKEQRTQK